MSRRKRERAAPRLCVMEADPALLNLLGDAVERADTLARADIVLWTPDAATRTPMPLGPALNVLDLRGRRPTSDLLHPAAGLLLAGSEPAAGAWAALGARAPIVVVPSVLAPAAKPAAEIRSLHILVGDGPAPPIAQRAAAWAHARGIACGILARSLALTAANPPPPLETGAILLDLRDDPLAPDEPVLEALALGAPLLFVDATPFRSRLERAGAALWIADLAELPERMLALSQAALAYVREHHDQARIGRSLAKTLLTTLAARRRDISHWPERGPGSHVLVISDEPLNLIDIRVHLPFGALLRRGAISGYSLLRHGDFVFSTTPITPNLRFGAIWVQRSTDPLVQLLLRALAQPFIYDLDDLLSVSPTYREAFAPETIEIVRALVRDSAVLSCATARLAQTLGAAAKAVVTPNLAEGDPRPAIGPARTIVWASSDKPALTGSRTPIERAVRDFCRAHRLKLLCIGAEPPASFADLDLEHVKLVSYEAYLERLRAAAPGILLGPLDTAADADTQAFIDAKSDIKVLEARRAGLIGVFSRAAPYLDSDLEPAILCDNEYRAWLDALERARRECERKAEPSPWPERRAADALGPLPWAEALNRAPADVSAAEIADALRFIRSQGETLLTSPDLFDEADYLRRHDDVRHAVQDGTLPSGYRHYVQSGFRERRAARRLPTANQAGEFWWSRLLHTVSRLEADVAARDATLDTLRDRVALRRALPHPTIAESPAVKDDHPWHPAGEIAGPCPVCDAAGPHPILMKILDHDLGRCRKCRSCFYANRESYLYENEDEAAVLLQLYLEQNAGIHQQTALLFALDGVASLLDIGCGFGFTVDLAASVLGWRAVGLDPSAMAAAGSPALGADIRQTYLTPDTDLGDRFDLVIASEVIEHIPEPYAFLALLRSALAPGGTLVLTTPNAGALEPGIGDARALCITAPRVHLILFTQESLMAALQRAGFRHVRVTARDDSLLAFASDHDLRFRDAADEAHLAGYRLYLERLLERAEPGTALWNGAAGRLFALLAPAADLAPLHTLFARIADAWRDRFAIDLARLRLPPLLTEPERTTTTAAALAARQPLNLAGVLLNRATLEHRTPGRTPEQVLAFARPAYLHALQTGRILQAANMIDHDLRHTAIRARMLILHCLAELAPEVATELLRGLAEPSPGALAEWLDPTPDMLAAHLAPAFVAAVSADQLDQAARLEPWLRDLDLLSRSLSTQPELLLRALFTIGIRRLNADHDPAAALEAFQRMATEARHRIDRIGERSPAHDFLQVAKEHIEITMQRLTQ